MNRSDLIRPLAELMNTNAAQRPDAVDPDAFRGVDHAELEHGTGRLAGHFGTLGVAPGDRIAFLLGDRTESVECSLAVVRAGGICVPVDPEIGDTELAQLLRGCGARLVVTDAAYFNRLDKVLIELSAEGDAAVPPNGLTVLMTSVSTCGGSAPSRAGAEEPSAIGSAASSGDDFAPDEEVWPPLHMPAVAVQAPIASAAPRSLWRLRWQAPDQPADVEAGRSVIGRRWAVIGPDDPGPRRIAGVEVDHYADFAEFTARQTTQTPDVIVLGFADHRRADWWLRTEGLSALPDDTTVICVTRGAVAADPGEVADPVGAAVWARVRALRPGRSGRLVLADLAGGEAWDRADPAMQSGRDELAVRQDRILVPRLVPVPAGGPVEPAALDPDGTVLITGAHTRVGRVVAAQLAARGIRRLVLAAPSVAGSAEAAAAAVTFGAATDSVAWHSFGGDAAGQLLELIPAAHPLTGVVHIVGPTLAEAAATGSFLDAVFQSARIAKHELAAAAVITTRTGVLGTPESAEPEAAAAFAQALAHRSAGLGNRVRTAGFAEADAAGRPAGTAELTSADVLDAFEVLTDPTLDHAGGSLLVIGVEPRTSQTPQISGMSPLLQEALDDDHQRGDDHDVYGAELIDELDLDLLHLAAHEADASRATRP